MMHETTLITAVVTFTLRGISGTMSNADAARSPGTHAIYPNWATAQRIMRGKTISIIPGSPKLTLLAVKAQIATSITIGSSAMNDKTMFRFTSHDFGPR